MDNPKILPHQCYTLSEVASMLGLTLQKVKRMVKAGTFPTVTIDGYTLVTPEAFEASSPAKKLAAQREAEEEKALKEREKEAEAEAESLRELQAQIWAHFEAHPPPADSPAVPPSGTPSEFE